MKSRMKSITSITLPPLPQQVLPPLCLPFLLQGAVCLPSDQCASLRSRRGRLRTRGQSLQLQTLSMPLRPTGIVTKMPHTPLRTVQTRPGLGAPHFPPLKSRFCSGKGMNLLQAKGGRNGSGMSTGGGRQGGRGAGLVG